MKLNLLSSGIKLEQLQMLLDVNPQTIVNMIKKGIFHPIKFGGATVISHNNLFAYLKSNKTNYKRTNKKIENV